MKVPATSQILAILTRFSQRATAAPALVACILLAECERICKAWEAMDRQGDANWFCEKEELSAVHGPSNWVVTGHATTCDGTVAYIYLHRTDAPERSINQIFRYVGVYPNIAWIAPNQIRVIVDGAQDVGKQVTYLNGITITYEIAWHQRWPSPFQNK